jgi:hypothetical protein
MPRRGTSSPRTTPAVDPRDSEIVLLRAELAELRRARFVPVGGIRTIRSISKYKSNMTTCRVLRVCGGDLSAAGIDGAVSLEIGRGTIVIRQLQRDSSDF